ncbi:aromatic ring-hydroxylating oxygenase subunit alpha [Burkholderia lata]|uniref:Rieske (2Fe-2S) protein n=1 Tax=Burkholderia lata (strain ATCC 17760 / DSM 23089 / LMG 22485 / NCIMB 9086 / R18194 / 383) TaxID=482957 RepID=Q39A68_BURL3|nr:aromatic ring-hydroxylating dioxygenase subunit alpha [Burkholderia lata]ABB10643.1 Rieske (2Fe-2S) protein [Burkholderia lata]
MQPISVVKKQDIVAADRWMQQRPERALTLPSRYFYDDAVFAAERDRIFMSAWHVIGHTSELSTPGQFVMTDVFDQSVIAACGRDGKVHAFHNVCQHRGNRLVEARRGEQKGLFRCAYHSWCYGADGSLRGAPRTDRVEDFDLAAYNIPKVRVEEFGGFYYFNLDPDAPSMRDLFPGADAEMKRVFPKLDAYRLIEEKDVIVPANWKVIMDNSIEGYHFSLSGPHHVELAGLIDFAGYRLTQHDKWWTYIAPANRDATAAYGVPLGDKNPDECFFNIGIWPHNTFYTFPYSEFLATFLIIPLEPEKTLLRFGYYSTHDTVPAVTKACMDWMNTDLGPEDIRLNISVQKGLHSVGYNQGRYVIDAQRSNESEHLVHHFHTLVHDGIHGA